jgi:hypothetical protein
MDKKSKIEPPRHKTFLCFQEYNRLKSVLFSMFILHYENK